MGYSYSIHIYDLITYKVQSIILDRSNSITSNKKNKQKRKKKSIENTLLDLNFRFNIIHACFYFWFRIIIYYIYLPIRFTIC